MSQHVLPDRVRHDLVFDPSGVVNVVWVRNLIMLKLDAVASVIGFMRVALLESFGIDRNRQEPSGQGGKGWRGVLERR